MFPVSMGILAQNEQNIGSFLGVDGEADGSSSKAVSEQGQQHRAQGKGWGGINSPAPNWEHFNPSSWINSREQVALVSPAITREKG